MHTLTPLLQYLRDWQAARLASTHADLLASPDCGPAAHFFITDLYAAKNFSQRDAEVMDLYDFVRHTVPSQFVQVLAQAIEANELSKSLDNTMVEVMARHLGIEELFTTVQYEEAYRLCDNYADRLRQIDLIIEVAGQVDRLRHLPLIGAAVRLTAGPAKRLGWEELYNFLKRGYEAWKPMKDARPFLETIGTREKAILNRIYRRTT
ncbi:MAG: hypothetical protein A2Z04_05395 [Chloroflexi bacterium RBG_16_57_9]|nr:MAG: hypothetical protein A2Z04_05395 [Chloroflexi bacterium RBG_16_57_9]